MEIGTTLRFHFNVHSLFARRLCSRIKKLQFVRNVTKLVAQTQNSLAKGFERIASFAPLARELKRGFGLVAWTEKMC